MTTSTSFLTLATRIMEDRRLLLHERLQRLVDVTAWALDHGDIAEVGVFLEGMTVTTAGFQETPWMLGAAVAPQSGQAGRFCIALTESPGGPNVDPFAPDERQLVGELARTIAEAIERSEAGRALDYLLDDEYLHRLLSAVPSMAYRRLDDSRWTLEFASLGCRVVTGFDTHDLMGNGLSYADLIKGHDRLRVQPHVHEAVLRGRAFQVTYTIRRVDGTERRVLDLGWPTLAEEGADAVVEGLVVDMTDALHEVGTRAGPQE